MGPLRIVILLILFYILYRLLVSSSGNRADRDGDTSRQTTADIRDILEEDPVCHVCIPRKQAITCKRGADTIYFCSHACRQQFLDGKRSNK